MRLPGSWGWHSAAVPSLDVSLLPTFLVAVLIIAGTPGPAWALIIRRASTRGFAAAVPTVLGLELGLLFWAIATGAGLAALIAASEVAFWAMRIVGAAFLAYLGIKAIRQGWSLRHITGELPPEPVPTRAGHAGAFGEGLMVQLANPKAALFLFAFYPPFLDPQAPLASAAVLGVIQVAVETPLYLAFAAGVGTAAGWFRRAAIRRRFEYVSGAILLLLAGRVALASR